MLTGVLFAGCCENEVNSGKQPCDAIVIPVLIDTIGIKYHRLYSDRDFDEMETAQYQFNYIGTLNDSIYLTYVPFFNYPLDGGSLRKTEFSKYTTDLDNKCEYKYADSADVCIIVGTFNQESYSVLLKNSDRDTIVIGYGDQVPLIMEARDSVGKWQPIQQRFIYYCSTGLSLIYLPPQECVVTLAPVYKGSYETELRLKLGNNYSKPFKGMIV